MNSQIYWHLHKALENQGTEVLIMWGLHSLPSTIFVHLSVNMALDSENWKSIYANPEQGNYSKSHARESCEVEKTMHEKICLVACFVCIFFYLRIKPFILIIKKILYYDVIFVYNRGVQLYLSLTTVPPPIFSKLHARQVKKWNTPNLPLVFFP